VRIVLPRGSYVPKFEWVTPDPSPVVAPDRTWLWKTSTALALAIAILAVWRPWHRVAAIPAATRLEVDLGAGVSLRSAQVGSSIVILAPDGRRLVFVSFRQDGVPRLMTLLLDQLGGSEPVELPGTEGARGPFFSWDGRSAASRRVDCGKRSWKAVHPLLYATRRNCLEPVGATTTRSSLR
jgi:hypothetical protein